VHIHKLYLAHALGMGACLTLGCVLPLPMSCWHTTDMLCCAVQGLEQLSSGSVPLPGAAAAVDTASSMFSGWGSWLGMASAEATPTDGSSASPLARKGSSASYAGSQSKLGS
jgi:hypothetical protein